MKIGLTIHASDRAMSPVELARQAEARGFHSLYIPEHTHIPISRRTPPPTGDDELAEEYLRSPDPCIALAGAATLTSTIRLGIAVALPAQHDPITFAKQIATLDGLSQGRLTLGIGFGWNLEEMENHGIDVKRRRERVRETMLAMQRRPTRRRQARLLRLDRRHRGGLAPAVGRARGSPAGPRLLHAIPLESRVTSRRTRGFRTKISRVQRARK